MRKEPDHERRSHRHSATHRWCWGVVLAASIAAMVGCTKKEEVDPGPGCDECHELAGLEQERSSGSLAEWLMLIGEGLVRKPIFPVLQLPHLGLRLPQRGHHTPGSTCGDCHPTGSGPGARHGERRYPTEALGALFEPGTGCASSECHPWLGDVEITGFGNGGFTGSQDPFSLLTGASNKHRQIFEEGFHVEGRDTSLRIASIRAGCGACHNNFHGDHGGLPDCTDCHVFQYDSNGGLHAQHTESIAATIDERHPDGPGQSSCLFCHGFAADSHEFYRAACYNCHLSGHQPSAGGIPQLW